MRISEILKGLGWKESTKSASYYGSSQSSFKHPSKKMEFIIQSKELWIDGKLKAKFSTSRKQDEVQFDPNTNLITIGNEIAIFVG
jgi:hypothetical protein